jgi:hypothetical protein
MRIFIRPKPGLIVLGPDGQALPAEGAFVEADSFWHRRLAKGEVAKDEPAGTVKD